MLHVCKRERTGSLRRAIAYGTVGRAIWPSNTLTTLSLIVIGAALRANMALRALVSLWNLRRHPMGGVRVFHTDIRAWEP